MGRCRTRTSRVDVLKALFRANLLAWALFAPGERANQRNHLSPIGLVGSIRVGQGRLAAPTERDPKLASPV